MQNIFFDRFIIKLKQFLREKCFFSHLIAIPFKYYTAFFADKMYQNSTFRFNNFLRRRQNKHTKLQNA